MVYDERGNLLSEQQGHGGFVTESSPKTSYTWEYAPWGTPANPPTSPPPNTDRLLSITYPDRNMEPGPAEIQRRVVQMSYGQAGGCDDLLSRVASMTRQSERS